MALHHAAPGEAVSLRPLGEVLSEGKTHALVKTQQFEAVRLIVLSGTTIPQHAVVGSLTLHCLEGRISLGLANSAVELAADDWIHLAPGQPHSLTGIEDSALLLTIIL